MLKVLLADSNSLQTLPSSLGFLFRIERLSLDNNPLQSPLLGIYYLGFRSLMAHLSNPDAPLPPLNDYEINFDSLELEGELGIYSIACWLEGEGFFGKVYKATWHKTDRKGNIQSLDVAVKVLKGDSLTSTQIDNFRREVNLTFTQSNARWTFSRGHRNISHIPEPRNVLFISMEHPRQKALIVLLPDLHLVGVSTMVIVFLHLTRNSLGALFMYRFFFCCLHNASSSGGNAFVAFLFSRSYSPSRSQNEEPSRNGWLVGENQ